MRTRACFAGYTLLEILIAVVLLALGILGGVALQMAALLSQATQLATGMAEHMRANAGQMRLGDGDNPYLTLNYDALAEPRPTAPAALCHGGACSGGQLALADLYEAKMLVQKNLPAGRVTICRDAGLWSGGKLRWQCGGGSNAPLVIKVGWRGKNPDGTPRTDEAGEDMPGVALVVGAMR